MIISLTKIYCRVTEFGPVCPQIIPDLSDEQEALRSVSLFWFWPSNILISIWGCLSFNIFNRCLFLFWLSNILISMWVVYISEYLQFFLLLFSPFNAQFSLAVNLFACFNFAHLMLILFISVLLSWLKILEVLKRT